MFKYKDNVKTNNVNTNHVDSIYRNRIAYWKVLEKIISKKGKQKFTVFHKTYERMQNRFLLCIAVI